MANPLAGPWGGGGMSSLLLEQLDPRLRAMIEQQGGWGAPPQQAPLAQAGPSSQQSILEQYGYVPPQANPNLRKDIFNDQLAGIAGAIDPTLGQLGASLARMGQATSDIKHRGLAEEAERLLKEEQQKKNDILFRIQLQGVEDEKTEKEQALLEEKRKREFSAATFNVTDPNEVARIAQEMDMLPEAAPLYQTLMGQKKKDDEAREVFGTLVQSAQDLGFPEKVVQTFVNLSQSNPQAAAKMLDEKLKSFVKSSEKQADLSRAASEKMQALRYKELEIVLSTAMENPLIKKATAWANASEQEKIGIIRNFDSSLVMVDEENVYKNARGEYVPTLTLAPGAMEKYEETIPDWAYKSGEYVKAFYLAPTLEEKISHLMKLQGVMHPDVGGKNENDANKDLRTISGTADILTRDEKQRGEYAASAARQLEAAEAKREEEIKQDPSKEPMELQEIMKKAKSLAAEAVGLAEFPSSSISDADALGGIAGQISSTLDASAWNPRAANAKSQEGSKKAKEEAARDIYKKIMALRHGLGYSLSSEEKGDWERDKDFEGKNLRKNLRDEQFAIPDFK